MEAKASGSGGEDAPAALPTGGGAGELLRAPGWAANPLGPPAAWTPELRTLVALMLDSRQPMFVAWGPEARMIYNDPYAEILGPRHPAAFGAPFAEVWRDIMVDVGPYVARALDGEAVHDDISFAMRRNGAAERRHFSFSYTPVRVADGSIAGLFCACSETTTRVRAERRRRFQLALSDALRPPHDPEEIRRVAAALLAEELGAAGVVYVDRMDAGGRGRVRVGHGPDAAPDALDFGDVLGAAFAAGRATTVADAAADATLDAAGRAALAGLGAAAALAAPLREAGRAVATLLVLFDAPREFIDDEIGLVEDVGERAGAAAAQARAEAERGRLETHLQLALSATGSGVAGHDLATGRCWTTPEWRDVMGFAAEEEVTPASLLDRVHPDDRTAARAALDAARSLRTPVAQEFRLDHPRRGPRWVLTQTVHAPDPNGGPGQQVTVALDRTEARRIEAARRVSEDRLRLALDAGRLGVWDSDIRQDRTLWDARQCEIYGAPEGFAPDGETFFGFVHPEDRRGLMEEVRRRLDDHAPLEAEFRIRRVDGAARWVAIRAVVEAAADGTAARMVGVTADVTEHKRAEAALLASEARLRHIVDGAVEYAIVTLDADRRIVSWNSGAERLLGHSEEEALGRSADMFFIEEGRAAGEPEAEMRETLRVGRGRNERWHVRRDGSRFWGSGVMLKVEGAEPSLFLKIFRDRTEERVAEENRRLLILELNHRVKNTLATVQAIANQTFRTGETLAEAREAFRFRIRALSEAHDVLTRENWVRADFRDIVRGALAPFMGETEGRVVVAGPRLFVTPRAGLSMALAVHELATNAAKFGALSSETGRVELRWHVALGRLHVRWEETGGPPVAPPARKGFGSILVERSLATEFGGEVRLDYAPAGVVCEIDAPLDRIVG